MGTELPKFASSINEGGGTFMMTELKNQFQILKTKKALSYGFVFFFIAFTIFLAFSPSPNPSSPLFSNIFSITSLTSSLPSSSTNGSHISSIFSYFSPNSSSSSSSQQASGSGTSNSTTSIDRSHNSSGYGEPNFNKGSPIVHNQTHPEGLNGDKVVVLKQNQSSTITNEIVDATANTTGEVLKTNQNSTIVTASNSTGSVNSASGSVQNGELQNKGEVLKANNQSSLVGNVPKSTSKENQASGIKENNKGDVLKANNQSSTIGTVSNSPVKPNQAANLSSGIGEKGVVQNLTSSLVGKKSNGSSNSDVQQQKQGMNEEDLVKSLVNCNLFDGNWVKDESYPLYKPGSCTLIDEQFNCFLNGRPDSNYYQLRWKPHGCTLPRLNGTHMLELLRGKRLVFVGDSLNRNMWESLICILRNSVKDQKKVYEASGRHHFRSEASYSFVFEDYKFTVEFYVSPFLVRESEFKNKDGTKKETLRLDLVGETATQYKTADFIVFNTGHWWTHDKTSLGKDYYQEGSHVYSELNVLEAFRKALTTWARWVDSNINPNKSHVFFRGYSASHFSGGQWNSGGACDHETEPIKNETYLAAYPSKMIVLENILKNMKTPVSYLNVTRLTDYRKDGHPSVYRKVHPSEDLQIQDCSHWCLPGVPDTWNEILYAQILAKQYQRKQGENKGS
ncbi:OLC1v1038217C1 [Oldenlandia corymbosa var. corymbosa]|uniref:OLC1v1038217C1 n=1 Tax=Oldenlandia corymbosa var. corymbosa TaxID=529605 RepID=A0AAV1D0F5_OLDCO|nr:OLC1v1038217C1 [Oldenlandia corymbosa var. corymbosa]